MSILKGTIYITDNPEIVYQSDLNRIKIINLDEDGILMDNEAIIGGTCLLPPIEAKIAEADGNEQLYDIIYQNHLLDKYQQEFIGAIISYLYIGGNFILFLPELGYNCTLNKLVEHMYSRYGIHIGIINNPDPYKANCYYDDKCIPIWLSMMYINRTISYMEFLYLYPKDALIANEKVMAMLIDEINPYYKSIAEKRDYILHLHQISTKPVKPAISAIRR